MIAIIESRLHSFLGCQGFDGIDLFRLIWVPIQMVHQITVHGLQFDDFLHLVGAGLNGDEGCLR